MPKVRRTDESDKSSQDNSVGGLDLHRIQKLVLQEVQPENSEHGKEDGLDGRNQNHRT